MYCRRCGKKTETNSELCEACWEEVLAPRGEAPAKEREGRIVEKIAEVPLSRGAFTEDPPQNAQKRQDSADGKPAADARKRKKRLSPEGTFAFALVGFILAVICSFIAADQPFTWIIKNVNDTAGALLAMVLIALGLPASLTALVFGAVVRKNTAKERREEFGRKYLISRVFGTISLVVGIVCTAVFLLVIGIVFLGLILTEFFAFLLFLLAGGGAAA